MEESQKDLGKNDDEQDEDNVGRDKYFMMGDDDISHYDSIEDEEDSKNTIPNINIYLNNNNNEIKEFVENSNVNPDLNIINNKIEDNFNMKNNHSQNQSLNNTNNININSFINNYSLNESSNKNNYEYENSFPREEILDKSQNIDMNKTRTINPNSKIGDNTIQISLSSEEDEEDDKCVEIIPGEQFAKHFQEDKYGPQRKIEIMEPDESKNIIMQNNFKKMIKKNKLNENKIFDNFFEEKAPKINKNEIIPKKNNNLMLYKNKNRNFNHPNPNEFIPIPKKEFKINTHFQKLLINRVEHQILTDIYNTYDDKTKFNAAYYHIMKLKNIMADSGVEKAIDYLSNIEPMELRREIAIESTYFFKEVIREEVENAKTHDGILILIKQSDFSYKRNLKNFSGKINYYRGNSMMRNNQRYDNYNMNHYQRNNFNNINRNNNGEYGRYKNNYFNKNPQMFKGKNIVPMERNKQYISDEQ